MITNSSDIFTNLFHDLFHDFFPRFFLHSLIVLTLGNIHIGRQMFWKYFLPTDVPTLIRYFKYYISI